MSGEQRDPRSMTVHAPLGGLVLVISWWGSLGLGHLVVRRLGLGSRPERRRELRSSAPPAWQAFGQMWERRWRATPGSPTPATPRP